MQRLGIIMWGSTIDGFVTIAFGLFACYLGFRSPPVSSDAALTAKWAQWHQTWGMWAKIGGVVLVLYGLFRIVTVLAGK